jgi:hypothetical protein
VPSQRSWQEQDDGADLAEDPADGLQHLLAPDRVLPDDEPLELAELPRLVDDLLRHAHLADVVEERCELGVPPVPAAQAHSLRNLDHERDDIAAVRAGSLIVRLDHPGRGKLVAALAVSSLVFAVGVGVGVAGNPPSSRSCPVASATSQPFLPWNDAHKYFLAPGGSMESDPTGAGWSLQGGAGLLPGSESFDVTGTADSKSLGLPNGSAAQTPPICVTIHDPELRFFVLNTGKRDAVLKVSTVFLGLDGKYHTHVLPDVHGGPSWTLTPPLKFKDSIQPGPDGTGQVSFVFAPKDNKGNWELDDLYVDPLKSQ